MASARVCGVYLINCLGNHKVYVGSSTSIKGRFASHLSMLRRGVHGNRHMQRAFAKYGEGSFVLHPIEACAPCDRVAREQAWIDYYKAHDPRFGMNNSPTATTSEGFKHSADTLALLSEKAKGRDHSHLLAHSKSLIGKPAHNRGVPGRKWTDEERAAMSAARLGRKAWNKGVPHSREHRQKIASGTSAAMTVYGSDVTQSIKALRAAGKTWKEISEATGVSLSQCNKIGRGIRK